MMFKFFGDGLGIFKDPGDLADGLYGVIQFNSALCSKVFLQQKLFIKKWFIVKMTIRIFTGLPYKNIIFTIKRIQKVILDE